MGLLKNKLTLIALLLIIPALSILVYKNVFIASSAGAKQESGPQEARYYKRLNNRMVQCQLCPHKCIVAPGQRGVCGVRENRGGKYYTLVYGLPCAAREDPIEKKPFFHVKPASGAFSIATAGCNTRCIFCQNWQISQARPEETDNYNFPPKRVVEEAIKRGCKSVVYTYTEPTVFYEYMLDTAKLAKEHGLLNAMHTCGYINPAPLKELCKYMDAANVDLKGFTPKFYTSMGSGQLQPVLETIKTLKSQGVWLELTNLVIPTVNDDPKVIKKMCRWIKQNVGPDVPLHFSRFWPNFKLTNLPATPVETLEKARQIALEEGLHYVYIGNVPGHNAENTYCPKCKKMLIERMGYYILKNDVKDGKCKFCSHKIAGLW